MKRYQLAVKIYAVESAAEDGATLNRTEIDRYYFKPFNYLEGATAAMRIIVNGMDLLFNTLQTVGEVECPQCVAAGARGIKPAPGKRLCADCIADLPRSAR